MENNDLKGRILKELDRIISRSCTGQTLSENFQNLHQQLLKKHYNATDVAIDYHRKRVVMEVVMDESAYDPRKVNLNLPTFRVNLLFKNLKEFLSSCISTDQESLSFYAWLLRSYTKKEVPLRLV